MVIILILKFIIILKCKTLYLYIIIMNTNNCLFSSIYKANDVSNVHVKSFYLHYVQNFQMSRGTVEHPSSNTLRLG